MRPVDRHMQTSLDSSSDGITENLQGADVISIFGPVLSGLDEQVSSAIERKEEKNKQIAIILETPGGLVEVVERIVQVIRHFYKEVIVVVPGEAMSAGTVFALSADKIMMNYFSRLGPIDPQIVKDDRLVPALAYLNQYEKLNEKAKVGELTTAEYAMLNKLDLGELYQFEQARELSRELLINWLSQYKFKSWKTTEIRNLQVTEEMKQKRAEEVADKLNDTDRWHSHARGIDILTLRNELKLKIDDFSENPELNDAIKKHYELLRDYLHRQKQFSFVHTRGYFNS